MHGPCLLPLEHLDSTLEVHALRLFNSKQFVYQGIGGMSFSHHVHKLVVILFTGLIVVDIPDDILLPLANNLVGLDLSSLVHPDHWKGKPNHDQTSNKLLKG